MRRTIFLIMLACLITVCFNTTCYAASFVWPTEGTLLTGFVSDAHRGIDITAENNQPIVSTQDGTVFSIGRTPRGEPYISIEHAGSVTSTYLPVKPCVKVGQQVSAGAQIGVLSSEIDPSADVLHLHFGIYDSATRGDKTYLDPCSLLPVLSGPTSAPTNNQVANLNPAIETPEITMVNAAQVKEAANGSNEQVIVKPETIREYQSVINNNMQAVATQSHSVNQISSTIESKSISELSNPTIQQNMQTRGIESSSNALISSGKSLLQPIVYHETPKGTVEPGIVLNQQNVPATRPEVVAHNLAVSKIRNSTKPELSVNVVKATAISTTMRVHKKPSYQSSETSSGSEQRLMSSRRVIDWPYLSTVTLILSMITMTFLSIKNYMRSAPRMPALASSY